MPVTWPDLRDIAKDLVASPDCSECSVRASVNRAYYAAFHALEPLCRAVPGDAPLHGPDGLSHKQIARRIRDMRLLAKQYPGLAKLALRAGVHASLYDAIKEARRDADYDLSTDFDIEAARLQLKRVQDLLDFAVHSKTEFDRLGIPY